MLSRGEHLLGHQMVLSDQEDSPQVNELIDDSPVRAPRAQIWDELFQRTLSARSFNELVSV